MWAKYLLAPVTLLLLTCYANADYDVSQYCQLVPVGTKLPSLTSCQTYYICLSSSQVLAANCTGTNIFDKDSQTCLPASGGNCAFHSNNPCANKNKVWVADTYSCGVWHYCANGAILGSGLCPSGEIFDEAIQLCQYGECATHNEGGVIVIENMCAIMQSNQFFGDFNSCNVWHKCNGMSLQSGTCQQGLVYDNKNRMCVHDGGNTCNGPSTACTIAQNGTLTADSSTCSVYYQCVEQNSKWLWQRYQCPVDQYYDVRMQGCRTRQAATPVATCDRCEFATTTWVNAVDSTCTKYLTCSNGREIANGTCSEPNSYFNEAQQLCLEGSSTLPNYRLYNGACALSINTITTALPTSSSTSVSSSSSTTKASTATNGAAATATRTSSNTNA